MENTTPKIVQDLLDKMAADNKTIDLNTYAWGLQHMYEYMVNRPLVMLAPPLQWGKWEEYSGDGGYYKYSTTSLTDYRYCIERENEGEVCSVSINRIYFTGTEAEVEAYCQSKEQEYVEYKTRGCKIVVSEESQPPA